jgi:quercetin dioxygenase-like cupin family protein
MDDPSGMVGRLVHADGRERRTELFALELPPGARRTSPAHLPGVEEVIAVTRGRATVGPDTGPERLGPGDAVWFAADVAHAYAATGPGRCHLLCVVLYPPV